MIGSWVVWAVLKAHQRSYVRDERFSLPARALNELQMMVVGLLWTPSQQSSCFLPMLVRPFRGRKFSFQSGSDGQSSAVNGKRNASRSVGLGRSALMLLLFPILTSFSQRACFACFRALAQI